MEIAEVETPSAFTGVVPTTVEFVALGLPGIKMTIPSAFTKGVAIESVLFSAFVDESVQVETPEELVTEQAE